MPQAYLPLTPLLAGLLIGFAVGALLAWFLLRHRAESAQAALSDNRIELTRIQEQLSATNGDLDRGRAELAENRIALTSQQKELVAAREECARVTERASLVLGLEEKRDELVKDQRALQAHVAELSATLNAEQKHSAEKLALLENVKEQLSGTFKTLANDILEERATRFAEQNKDSIGQILEPLKTKLAEYQLTIDRVHLQDLQGREALGAEVRQLTSLNQRLSEDAQNLARALKGSAKTQGNWGEMILVRLLEVSGLHEGRDYELRPTYERDDGQRGQPDVVVNLPSERHLVVDSKVSLTDYTQYVNSEEDTARAEALGRHLDSMHRHVEELSAKDYQKLCGLHSLDFVIMFVPVESAFAVALAEDTALWELSWSKNVLLVSPSTLLFVLRTVAYLWRQEDQSRNVQDIAHRGAELYNKLVGFVEDLDQLDRLTQARDSFDTAYKKLSTGQGNVIRQAEMLRDLGVKPSKSLRAQLVESARDSDEIVSAIAAVAEAEAVSS